MNESTLIQLKILVERVVRPVRASTLRKRRMRDELLAHVTSSFEEELARLADEQAALQQTAARLGNPIELTAQLQSSVPKSDHVKSFIDQLWSRPGESWLRRVFRQVMLTELLLLALLLLPWLLAGHPTKAFDAVTMKRVLPDLIGVVIGAASFLFLAEWMFRALHGPKDNSKRVIVLISATCGFAFFAFGLWQDGLDPADLILATAFGLLWAPAGLWSLARVASERIRYHQEWADLPI